MDRSLLTLIILIMVSGAGCKLKNQLLVRNFHTLYHPDTRPLITGIRVFHQSDDLSDVYIRYDPASLSYEIKTGSFYHRADYQFSYKVFESYESGKIIDSASVVVYDSLYYQNPDGLVYVLPVRTPRKGHLIMELKFTDLNTGTSSYYPVSLIKDGKFSSQNFLPVNEDNEVIFENWVDWKTRFRIITTDPQAEWLWVDYYQISFPPARPPFTGTSPESFQLIPAETFRFSLDNGISEFMQFGREGIFRFRLDTTQKEGLTIFRFGDDYPAITGGREMIESMRYILTEKEFRTLLRETDPDQAIRQFWFNLAGNQHRAEVLRNGYFEKVERANRFFTSYKEGWKTDRGMIYIVFGQPGVVLKRTGTETWIYGDPDKRTTLRFDFVEMDNPLTRDDYELVRKPEYKMYYYQAVNYLRK